ncbi:MAG: hypothetical protein WCA27_20720 [Candidatus Sulfotelmatobacter sp.]
MRSSNPAERFAAALLIPGVLAKRLRQLRDFEIGQLLDDEVGAHLNVLAPESTICLGAVERLRGRMNTSPERERYGIRRRARRSFAAQRDEGTHILSAEVALYRAGIPFLQLPWQRNRFGSDTFMVISAAEAQACLLRAGFRERLRSPTVFIDGRTRQPIHLYEDKHNPAQSKS